MIRHRCYSLTLLTSLKPLQACLPLASMLEDQQNACNCNLFFLIALVALVAMLRDDDATCYHLIHTNDTVAAPWSLVVLTEQTPYPSCDRLPTQICVSAMVAVWPCSAALFCMKSLHCLWGMMGTICFCSLPRLSPFPVTLPQLDTVKTPETRKAKY